MKTEITKEGIRNKKGLWQWIKKECECDNVEHISLETIVKQAPTENSTFTIPYVDKRILTIELGAKRG